MLNQLFQLYCRITHVLLASGVKNGDEVIIPALTFVADANVVKLCGATPVLADYYFT